jgi:hypothetical protein
MKKEVGKSIMIGVILAALVIGGIVSAIVAVSTNDEELRELAIKGVADAIKAFVIYLLVTVAVVTAGVYALIQALH